VTAGLYEVAAPGRHPAAECPVPSVDLERASLPSWHAVWGRRVVGDGQSSLVRISDGVADASCLRARQLLALVDHDEPVIDWKRKVSVSRLTLLRFPSGV
jgi:hypothetical protein